ncbi:hypothetical protein H0H92_003243 [Tricholoma furcatifolium]|nr:hypothetical protein H0H92_003243 [Tricholoma furcatifolium]
MSTGSSSQLPSWDQSKLPSTSRRKIPVQTKVPDDCDDDDDEGGLVTEESNQRIWDDANTKAPNPMPELIIAPSAKSISHVVPPPAGVFQPTMRILKRPSSTTSKSATPPPSSSTETLKEREARYQAARDRIFGPDSSPNTPMGEEPLRNASQSPPPINFSGKRDRTKPSTPPATGVVRNPRGPPSGSVTMEQTIPRGFGGQRAKPPSPPNDPPLAAEG